MTLRNWAIALTCLLCWHSNSHVQAGLVFSLDNAVVETHTASMDVRLSFTGDPADTLEGFQLSVIGSDGALTAGGTDYSRFGFLLNTDPAGDSSQLFSTWSAFPGIGDSGFTFVLPDDLFAGPFLSPQPGTYLLGKLTVDLAGLAAGTYTVTLGGNDPLFPTLGLGTMGGNYGEFVSSIEPVDGVSFEVSTVPEPASATLLLMGVAAAAGARWRSGRNRVRSQTV